MATRFVNIDRETPLLFPPDLRDWVEKDDLVHFVLEAVETLPLQCLHENRRGTGSEQYPPRMMLGLLVYCYATGTFSSRAIESLTYRNVSVRYLCANTHPDHDTICRFRVQNKALLEETFVAVLQLAAELKISQLGTVSIDGTKVFANASKHSAVSYQRAGEMIDQLQLEVDALLHKAQEADSVPLQDGLSIPSEIARREDRQKKLQAARAAIEARVQAQTQEKLAEHEEKLAERQARVERGEKPRGRQPQAPSREPEAKEQHNFTDPQSRIMKAGSGQHFEQAYNAQAAVATDTLLIVGQRVSDAPNDKQQLQATLQSIPESLGVPTQVLVDSGYFSSAQIEAIEAVEAVEAVEVCSQREISVVDSNIIEVTQEDDSNDNNGRPQSTVRPIVYAAVGRQKHRQPLSAIELRPDPDPPPEGASTKEKMRHRMSTAQGREVYKLRKQTVEPVFGIIKSVLGFRGFSLRGLEKVAQEWTLVCLAWNVKRLHKLIQQTKPQPTA